MSSLLTFILCWLEPHCLVCTCSDNGKINRLSYTTSRHCQQLTITHTETHMKNNIILTVEQRLNDECRLHCTTNMVSALSCRIMSLQALDEHVIADEEIIENMSLRGTFRALSPQLKLQLYRPYHRVCASVVFYCASS